MNKEERNKLIDEELARRAKTGDREAQKILSTSPSNINPATPPTRPTDATTDTAGQKNKLVDDELKRRAEAGDTQARAILEKQGQKSDGLEALGKNAQQAAINILGGEEDSPAKQLSEMIVDGITSAAQSTSLDYADEAVGKVAEIYAQLSGDIRDPKEINKEAAQAIRNIVAGSRDRSPFASFVGEIIAPNPFNKIKYAKKASNVLDAAVRGSGSAQEGERIEGAALGGTLGTIGSAGVKAIKGAGGYLTDPVSNMANYLGKTKIASRFRGTEFVKEIDASIKGLMDAGVFYKGVTDYDPVAGKFKIPKTSWFRAKIPEFAERGDIEANFAKILKVSGEKLEELLTKGTKGHPPISVKSHDIIQDMALIKKELMDIDVNFEKDIDKAAYERIKNIFGINNDILKKMKAQRLSPSAFLNKFFYWDTPKTAQVMRRIESYPKIIPRNREYVPLWQIQREKQKIQKTVSKTYASRELPPVQEQFLRRLAKSFRENIEAYSDDPLVKKINKQSGRILDLRDELEDKIAGEPLTRDSFRVPYMGGNQAQQAAGWFNQALEGISDYSRPLRAYIGRNPEKYPRIYSYAEEYAKRLPGRTLPYATRGEEDFGGDTPGRTPQSMQAEQDLINTPLPRNSKSILENQELFIEKLRMMGGDVGMEQATPIIEAINRNPRVLPELAPPLVMMMPNLFQFDKYNRFDGVILTPEGKALATKDTENNQKLKEDEKTVIIDKINRTGEFDAPYLEDTI